MQTRLVWFDEAKLQGGKVCGTYHNIDRAEWLGFLMLGNHDHGQRNHNPKYDD